MESRSLAVRSVFPFLRLFQGIGNIFFQGEPGKQLVKALKYHNHLAGRFFNRFSLQKDAAGVRLQKPSHKPQQGGLATAALPQNHQEIPFPDSQADMGQNFLLGRTFRIFFAYIRDF